MVLEGRKTYIGIIIGLLGGLGAFKYVSEGDLTTFLNVCTTIVGALIAIYGRYKAKPK